mmetsp:Transcript_8791/g.11765  ORF Transcript_8791/g.11765 Transcript_8791/m.11765 type:complete len:84 (+) Transcript_8791:2335-2586(+)
METPADSVNRWCLFLFQKVSFWKPSIVVKSLCFLVLITDATTDDVIDGDGIEKEAQVFRRTTLDKMSSKEMSRILCVDFFHLW